VVLSILGGIASIRAFQQRSGRYFFVALALLVLAIAILYTLRSVESVRLFAKRLAAFIVDLLLFALVTFALVGHGAEPLKSAPGP
jgi:hypothetical protein